MKLNEIIQQAKLIDFEQYIADAQKQIQAKEPIPPYHLPGILHYTERNLERMEQFLPHVQINKKLYNLLIEQKQKQHWIIITEAWCGDAAASVPVMTALSNCSENIQLQIARRDENPELMNLFLTNGGKGIPILVILDEQMNLLAHWGPRPAEAQKIALLRKDADAEQQKVYNRMLHDWYTQDAGKKLQEELYELLKNTTT